MTSSRISTGFATLRDKELDQKAQLVLASLTNNPAFPNPTPPLSELQTAVTDYQQALVRVESGAKIDRLNKQQKREVLELLLDRLSKYVLYAAQDDPNALLSSGFDLVKPRTSVGALPKPENLKVLPGEIEGSVFVSVQSIRNARGYLVEYTVAPETPASQWTAQAFSKSANLLTGLESGKQYVFRVAAIGSDPTRVYSDKISRFVA